MYDYECKNSDCNHKFEIKQSIHDEKITKCPKCKKETCKKVILSAPGVSFKGQGWTPKYH